MNLFPTGPCAKTFSADGRTVTWEWPDSPRLPARGLLPFSVPKTVETDETDWFRSLARRAAASDSPRPYPLDGMCRRTGEIKRLNRNKR